MISRRSLLKMLPTAAAVALLPKVASSDEVWYGHGYGVDYLPMYKVEYSSLGTDKINLSLMNANGKWETVRSWFSVTDKDYFLYDRFEIHGMQITVTNDYIVFTTDRMQKVVPLEHGGNTLLYVTNLGHDLEVYYG